jgi:hypothetical protein
MQAEALGKAKLGKLAGEIEADKGGEGKAPLLDKITEKITEELTKIPEADKDVKKGRSPLEDKVDKKWIKENIMFVEKMKKGRHPDDPVAKRCDDFIEQFKALSGKRYRDGYYVFLEARKAWLRGDPSLIEDYRIKLMNQATAIQVELEGGDGMVIPAMANIFVENMGALSLLSQRIHRRTTPETPTLSTLLADHERPTLITLLTGHDTAPVAANKPTTSKNLPTISEADIEEAKLHVRYKLNEKFEKSWIKQTAEFVKKMEASDSERRALLEMLNTIKGGKMKDADSVLFNIHMVFMKNTSDLTSEQKAELGKYAKAVIMGLKSNVEDAFVNMKLLGLLMSRMLTENESHANHHADRALLIPDYRAKHLDKVLAEYKAAERKRQLLEELAADPSVNADKVMGLIFEMVPGSPLLHPDWHPNPRWHVSYGNTWKEAKEKMYQIANGIAPQTTTLYHTTKTYGRREEFDSGGGGWYTNENALINEITEAHEDIGKDLQNALRWNRAQSAALDALLGAGPSAVLGKIGRAARDSMLYSIANGIYEVGETGQGSAWSVSQEGILAVIRREMIYPTVCPGLEGIFTPGHNPSEAEWKADGRFNKTEEEWAGKVWGPEWDIALAAGYLATDVPFEHREEYFKHVMARLEVWLKGYALLCDIDGELYVYASDELNSIERLGRLTKALRK